MNNYDLSICIPSNKDVNYSKNSISSAIGFCESNSSEIVISDNSEDKNKYDLWNNLNIKYLKYIKSDKKKSWQNWKNAVENSSGTFVGILGDDDLILNISKSELDYNFLPNNVIGIKPNIMLWSKNTSFYDINNYQINQETPSERIKFYIENNKGNNTTLYSFYRRDFMLDLLNLVCLHPTQGEYLDWVFVITLVGRGKIINDNNKLLIYKNSNWTDKEKNLETNKLIYKRAGLDEKSIHYASFLKSLDIFIFMMYKNSKIKREKEIELAYLLLKRYFISFKAYVDQNKLSNIFSEEIFEITDNIIKTFNSDKRIEANIKNFFDSSLEILRLIDTNLAFKYKEFYNLAIVSKWGNL